MAIPVNCPGCGKRFAVQDRFAGRRGKCPGCGTAVAVPETAARDPAPPAPELRRADPGPRRGDSTAKAARARPPRASSRRTRPPSGAGAWAFPAIGTVVAVLLTFAVRATTGTGEGPGPGVFLPFLVLVGAVAVGWFLTIGLCRRAAPRPVGHLVGGFVANGLLTLILVWSAWLLFAVLPGLGSGDASSEASSAGEEPLVFSADLQAEFDAVQVRDLPVLDEDQAVFPGGDRNWFQERAFDREGRRLTGIIEEREGDQVIRYRAWYRGLLVAVRFPQYPSQGGYEFERRWSIAAGEAGDPVRVPHGLWRRWRKGGKLVSEYRFDHGRLHGVAIDHGPHDGPAIGTRYDRGRIVERFRVEDGERIPVPVGRPATARERDDWIRRNRMSSGYEEDRCSGGVGSSSRLRDGAWRVRYREFGEEGARITFSNHKVHGEQRDPDRIPRERPMLACSLRHNQSTAIRVVFLISTDAGKGDGARTGSIEVPVGEEWQPFRVDLATLIDPAGKDDDPAVAPLPPGLSDRLDLIILPDEGIVPPLEIEVDGLRLVPRPSWGY